MYKKTTLKNGLRIITVPQKSTQAVTVLVLVGTGSKYEIKELSGISVKQAHNRRGERKIPCPSNKVPQIQEALIHIGLLASSASSTFVL